ncbi:epithelial membrane protein 1 [Platysternon megacephalum]|uniref:Epithelial membrane protein 1 n=1 Tax=Platysternon megacephalum TaxID=55544 RepID=A0A4D9EJ38_9SAUR|nr:epithelial membrane protein 1 [Platysternon megacephalum]
MTQRCLPAPKFKRFGDFRIASRDTSPLTTHSLQLNGNPERIQAQEEHSLKLRCVPCGEPGSVAPLPAPRSSRNQLENHLLKDQEEDQEEAKTRVPLKQLRRKQKPLEKNDPEAGPENG